MYIMYNVHACAAYQCDYEWYMEFGNEYVYLTESIWMVPGTVDPMEG